MRWHALSVAVSRAVMGVAVLVGAACASGPGSATTPSASPSLSVAQNRVPTGVWGGVGISLEVVESGARAEFDCAYGTIEPLVVDADRRFDVAGTLVIPRGGPAREDDPPPSAEPARYSGSLDGDTLTITVTLAKTGQSVGTYALARGAEPHLRKCL